VIKMTLMTNTIPDIIACITQKGNAVVTREINYFKSISEDEF